MEKNMKMWLWVGAVVIIILLAVYFIMGNQQTSNNQTTTETPSVQDTNNTTSANGIIISTTAISYADALVKYANRRIQLDPTCQAHPNMVNYKDNTGIMIDNRSAKTRTIKIGTTFAIQPYSFKVVILPDVYLKSKTIFVDCDGSQNVATIVVQE